MRRVGIVERSGEPCVPVLICNAVRSRRKMSLRVSQPLWPPSTFTSSDQACPNWSPLYPAVVARSRTGSAASATSAVVACSGVESPAGEVGAAAADSIGNDAAAGGGMSNFDELHAWLRLKSGARTGLTRRCQATAGCRSPAPPVQPMARA